MVRRLGLTGKGMNEGLGLTVLFATAPVLAAVAGLANDGTWALLAVVMVVHLSGTALVVGAALATAADGQASPTTGAVRREHRPGPGRFADASASRPRDARPMAHAPPPSRPSHDALKPTIDEPPFPGEQVVDP
jgi:hypothetical protein